LSERLSTHFFPWANSATGGCERNEIWHKGILGDEDDARTLNACVAQRKRDTTLSDEK